MTRAKRLVLSVALLGSAGFGCKKDNDDLVGPGQGITVYTRNLYLGSEITPLAAIPSPEAIPGVAATLWANIQASDYPERAKVLAEEIFLLAPDLVALQEVTLYRRQMPGDFQPGDDVPNATEVVLDFLAILMAEIDARGGGYRVVGEALNVDAEVPVDGGAAGPFDLRLTDRDVILARDTVQTSNFIARPFAAKYEFVAGGTGGIPIALTRSTSRVDAVLGDAHFTFANAHLEIQLVQLVQTAQATELLSGIASVPDPVLLLGDFNSEPGMNSYPLLTAPFDDAWDDAGGGAPGFTCCQAGNLMNPESTAGDRIDLVLYRGRFRVNDMAVMGTDPATGRTPGGLWASDHFGVLAHVELVP
jgi:endonuclease/exonuclease/phosphatase family metal-dependent hydrolase